MRLRNERDAIIEERTSLIEFAYSEYKEQLRPIEWIHLPPINVVCAMQPFRRLIYSDPKIWLEQETCDRVARRLPTYLAAFRNKLRGRLVDCPVQTDDGGDGIRTTDKAKKYLVKDIGLGYRSLAVDVFTLIDDAREKPIYMFGIDDVFAQLSYPDSELHRTADLLPDTVNDAFWVSLVDSPGREGKIADCTLRYNKRASDIVRNLLAELGLDPMTAQAEDLDRLDVRIACRYKKCKKLHNAYTWRCVVSHLTMKPLPKLIPTLGRPLGILSQGPRQA